MPLFAQKPVAESILECPHDKKEMERQEVAGTTIDRCTTCGGTWFDAKELRRVANDKELEILATRIPIVKVPSPFACPRCGGECIEGHVSEVEVDTCTSCQGVWLDRGELTEAQRLMRTQRLLDASGTGFRGFLTRL